MKYGDWLKPAIESAKRRENKDDSEIPLAEPKSYANCKLKRVAIRVIEHLPRNQVGKTRLFVLNSAVILAYIACFSFMGYGDQVYLKLKKHSSFANYFACSSVSLMVTLYVFDFSYWKGKFLVLLKRMLCSIALAGVCCGCILAVNTLPAAPMSVCMIVLPLTASLQKTLFYPKKSGYAFLDAWSKVLGIWAVVVFSWWWVWVLLLRRWWSSDAFAINLECENKNECAAAFLLWFNPCLLSFVCGSACVLVNFLSWALRPNYLQHDGRRGMKLFTFTAGMISAGMWLVACVAAGGMRLIQLLIHPHACCILGRYGVELRCVHVYHHFYARVGVRHMVRDSSSAGPH
jgi:hypothetical protein